MMEYVIGWLRIKNGNGFLFSERERLSDVVCVYGIVSFCTVRVDSRAVGYACRREYRYQIISSAPYFTQAPLNMPGLAYSLRLFIMHNEARRLRQYAVASRFPQMSHFMLLSS